MEGPWPIPAPGQGVQVGKGLYSPEDGRTGQCRLDSDKNDKLVLPVDHIASEDMNSSPISVKQQEVPKILWGLILATNPSALPVSSTASKNHFLEWANGAI